jgi:hypothetical protein
MDDRPADHAEQPEDEAAGTDARRFTRRQAVAGGAAFGAAVVWTSQFPFADAAIGQVIRNVEGATGATGPTGPPEKEETKPETKTETKTAPAATGSTGTTSATGSTGATGAPPPFRFPQIKVALNGDMAITVNFPSAGDFELLVTNGNSLSRIAAALKPGPGRSAFARAHVHSNSAGIVRLKAKPTKAGAKLLGSRQRAHLPTPLRANVKFTPASGRPTTMSRGFTLNAKHR